METFGVLVVVGEAVRLDLDGITVFDVLYLDDGAAVLDRMADELSEFDRLTGEIDLDSQPLADGKAVERAIELAKRIGDADQDLPVARIGHVDADEVLRRSLPANLGKIDDGHD